MKGMLLLLALLDFWTMEACIPFFEVRAAISIGNKGILHAVLNKFDPTDGDREAFAKIMKCFNDAGVESKILKAKFLHLITDSPECKEYYILVIKDKN